MLCQGPYDLNLVAQLCLPSVLSVFLPSSILSSISSMDLASAVGLGDQNCRPEKEVLWNSEMNETDPSGIYFLSHPPQLQATTHCQSGFLCASVQVCVFPKDRRPV